MLSRQFVLTIMLLTTVFWSFGKNCLAQRDIQFVERFALAEDREQVLGELVPGTEAFYFFHCLHYQNTEQFDKVDQLLKTWRERLGQTQLHQQIRHRQALMSYDRTPQETLDYLIDVLNLSFSHQRKIPSAERGLPSKLDPRLISYQRLYSRAMGLNNTQRFEDEALEKIDTSKVSASQLRHLLERLQRPHIKNLPQLIHKDLQNRNARAFGSYQIHRQLLRSQLDELLELRPKLRNETAFVNIYLSKLAPSNDVNPLADHESHQQYLDRLWQFVSTLDPVHNSLKAVLLYRRLELDRAMGTYDQQRFEQYLQLPRQVGYVSERFLKNIRTSRNLANLSADFRQQIRLLPIRIDEPLVRDYLHHFLKDANDYKQYLPWIKDTYLKQRFAETKIVNGLGDKERWASMLSPAQYQQLVKRIDLDFAFDNPRFHGVNDAVEVELYTKNVKNLLVKVFEINTANYYKKHSRKIDTDINLDGLVPNWQKSFQYSDSPARRLKREFSFDEIDHAGVYIIDFIGNGKSSRALIRKGQLHHLVETTAAGHSFTILDADKNPVNDATLWIAGREYKPGEEGRILVPFSTQPKWETVIIQRGQLCALANFSHFAESYALNAGFYVDRESLLRAGSAEVAVRPQLLSSGNPAPLGLLSDVSLTVRAVDTDGVASTKKFSNLKIDESSETSVEIQVPGRLSEIQFALTASVENVSRGEKQTVQASRQFTLNQIDKTDQTQTVHLKNTESGYKLAVRGKTGEQRGGQAVLVKLKHRLFRDQVSTTLQSNENGQIELGTLPDIVWIEATLNNGTGRNWKLNSDRQVYYSTVHAKRGETIEIPIGNDIESTSTLSLLEIRRGTYTADYQQSINLSDGLIRLTDLPAGDYELFIKPEQRPISVKVAAGKADNNYALADSRDLELRNDNPLHVKKIDIGAGSIIVQLGGDAKLARVHVYATRYQPRYDVFAEFAPIRDVEPIAIQRGVQPSAYMAGRTIGEELRYILERRFAKKYAGNMLTRPSFLLNPWAIRTTENMVQAPTDGDQFGGAGGATDAQQSRGEAEQNQQALRTGFANLDFLAEPTAVLLNLRPDENGVLTIDREKLGNKQMVQIVVEDHEWSLVRNVLLDEKPLKIRDMRLANGLDPDGHFAQRKEYRVITTDEDFELVDLLSAKFQHYDDLGDVYRYYVTLTGNQQLVEFGFLMNWSNLSDEQKFKQYTKYAGHELNFFLMHKDPEYFESVVLPYIENKLHKTYLDHYLLNNDLEPFAQPWEFKNLNVVEQILLGRRRTSHRSGLNQHVNDAYDLSPTDRRYFDQLYNFAVKGSSLDRDGIAGKFEKSKADYFKSIDEVVDGQSRLGLQPSGGAGGGRQNASGEDVRFADDKAGVPRMAQLESLYSRNAPKSAASPAPARKSRGRIASKDAGIRADNSESAKKRLADLEEDADSVALGREGVVAGAEIRAVEQLRRSQSMRELKDQRKLIRQFYRRLKPTQEWVENNYYHLPIEQQNAQLVTVNRYWRDYALHNDAGPFLSPYFAEASRNATEMLMALAVLDLPFEAPEHEFEFTDNNMNLTPKSNLIAFYQQVRPAVLDRGDSNVLISENFFRKDDRYRTEDGKKYDKFIRKEFLSHVLYGGQVVITNPTSTPQAIDVLIQIPAGSMPASGSQETRTIQMDLNAFSTQTMEYYFYFPAPGDFAHYPAHVSLENRVVAVADPIRFNVVAEPSEIDTESWAYISQNGTQEQVIVYLENENLQNINLAEIAFRVKDKAFFSQVTRVLRNRFAYDHTLWSYAIKHNVARDINHYLKHANSFLQQCGSYLDTELVTIDPVARKWYQHREFWPLVNARSHQLGANRKILNDRIWQQYHQMLEILARRNRLSADDRLGVTYYLLLQDRISEGLKFFDSVSRDNVKTQLQYDYCDAYVAMYLEDPDRAEQVAKSYIDYPVKRWRDLFQTVMAHVKEIQTGQAVSMDVENQTESQTELASKTPSFEFVVESRKARIEYQNLKTVTVNYYQMDVELLFSRSPFVQRQNDGFAMIRPNQTQSISLPADQTTHEIELPVEFHNSNVLVEITGAGNTKSQAYYANSLGVQVIEQYGQMRVTSVESKKPLPKVYVKVYARKADGSVHFYKDGYTDLRGRFDYASLSNQKLDDVTRFSMLVMSDEFGAVVREADIPKE